MISQDTIQQVVNRIDIVEIVSEFVRLKRRGANYLGLCPFHDEKTPSFTVSPTKEIYKCFGCGKSGNAITFLMEHEKYSYVEAIRWLAKKYQVEIEETETSPEYKQQQLVAESLFAINNFAQKHFTSNLKDTEEGRTIGLSYLKQRGFREHTIEAFDLGFCLSDHSFSKLAIQQQFNKDLLIKSGLSVFRDGHYLDNYRGRVIFPVHNQTGKIVGFGARLIEKNDKAPKYINTPENEIYIKSKILYGLWQARQAIGKKDECILVEGYTDVVSLHQAGIENVVASGGTSLTHDQLRLIRKLTPNLTIFYDGDAAGMAAAMRGLDMALEEGLNVKIVSLPSSEDPDSYIKNFGASALEEYIREHKKEFIFFQLDWALSEAGNDPVKKSNAVKKIAESISKLSRPEDFVIRQAYTKKIAERLDIEEEGLISLINSIARESLEKNAKRFLNTTSDLHSTAKDASNLTTEPGDKEPTFILDSPLNYEKALVRCLLEYGSKKWKNEQTVADYLLNEWDMADILKDEMLTQITDNYRRILTEGRYPDLKVFLYNEDEALSNTVVSLIAFPYEVSKNWKEKFNQEVPEREDQYIADITSTLQYIDMRNIRNLLEENERELQKQQTAEKLIILLKTHQHLKSLELEIAKHTGTVILK